VDQDQIETKYQNPETNNRNAVWQRTEARVNEYRDGLGKRVDEGIKPAVTALNALGFETSGSCEGHMDRASAAPWVDVTVQGTDAKFEAAYDAFELADQAMEKGLPELTQTALFKRAHTLRREAEEPIAREAVKILPLLEEFYRGRETPYAARIILNIMGSRFRLESQGAAVQPIYTQEEKQKNLDLYHHEMTDFSHFLKDRFFK
jgi:hypothetical protein